MKLEKTAAGTYHCRKTIDGKTYSFTFDRKPNKIELEHIIKEKVAEVKEPKRPLSQRNFKKVAEEYLKARDVLSPSTTTNYRSILRNLSERFITQEFNHITSVEVQQELDDYSKTHSRKSTVNASGFIHSVFDYYGRPLPKSKIPASQVVSKKKDYVPTDDDVSKILQRAHGTPYEIAFRLAVYGLRKSEVLAIDKDSLDGNMLTINQAKVVNDKGEYVPKGTKTEAGTRKIYIDDELADMIREQGCAYKGFPGNILRELHRAQDDLGIPRFRLHDFRVYYASMCHARNIPDAYIMKTGGWRSQQTLDTVYRKAQMDKTEEIMRANADIISSLMKK